MNELAAIKRTVARYKSNPKALYRAMQKAGIIDEKGQLTKEYKTQEKANG